MKTMVAPSVLAADMLKLGAEVKRAEEAGADMLHCDVMDGIYVPNISFGFGVIAAIKSLASIPLDVHMMTAKPGEYLDVLKQSGADIVTVHHDAGTPEEVSAILRAIRERGMKAAVAISPKIAAEEALPFLQSIDMVLVMTVEPGFGGQSFMDMSDKVRFLRAAIDSLGLNVDIEVDGGINSSTAEIMRKAGANVFVVGTGAFRAPDMAAAIAAIR